MSKKKRFFIKPKYVAVVCFCILLALGSLILAQNAKLDEIAQKKAALQEESNALKAEEQRIERMLEYVQGDEYLEQYARERFGYVMPDDIKFYKEEEESNASRSD